MAEDVQLQENHPDRYTVVKGDTLWGISGKFLKDPWQWPKVWKMNRAEIKNPHLIYPGDTIVLDMTGGSPQLRLLRETVILEPGVREEALEKAAIPTISLYNIAAFLSQPLVIENHALNDAPVIVGHQESRIVLSPGTKIYVDRIDDPDRNKYDTFWQVYRNGKVLTDAVTNEPLGTEAFYLGDAQVTQFGEPASAEILRATEEIFDGDRLVAYPEESTNSFVPRAPEDQIFGSIISIYGGVRDAGPYSIVTIDRGSNDGLEDGHVLAIYQGGKTVPDPVVPKSFIKLPDERIGLVMIFRTFERVSYGLIMQASGPVEVLNLVKTP